ncbi:uncharacterized protein LOC123551215 [Mercenaria mercenaria]|uniref:uncharacterized protein LOC123551215 n=1 Tax=Mercenaria mercenaria TaxID=6596 RepID=UPI00234ED4CC|nr:uncharacterized protein LOC123551215 [Mercenaria mercenaria]XP_045195904.2 uncharacterized protein LOC123551215 [Mercenaria mercenaria]
MESIKKTLTQYPSSFNVAETMAVLRREEIVKIKNKLIAETDSSVNEFSTNMEKIRVKNLLSYLYYNLGERNKAAEYNQTVLELSPNNVIALTNKAWFSLRDRKNVIACQKVCEHLKSLRSDRLTSIVAKAEVAFTYSRLGLKHYQKAVSEFENVLQECKKVNEETETASSSVDCSTRDRIPAEYICVWMYGRALCQQRLSNFHNMYDVCKTEKLKENCKLTLDLFKSIIELNECDNECIKRYKARSYIEVGLTAYDVNRNRTVFPRGMANLLPEHSPLLMQTANYFTTALWYFPEDVFVLERSGKYFRYENDVEQSIHLLIKAIQIKPTSFGYHHLAISFIRLLEHNKGELAYQLQSIPLEHDAVTDQSLDKATTAFDMWSQTSYRTREASDYPNENYTRFNDPAIPNEKIKRIVTMPQGHVKERKHVIHDRFMAAQPVEMEKTKKYYRNRRFGYDVPNSQFRNRKDFRYFDDKSKNSDQSFNVPCNSRTDVYSTKQPTNVERRNFHYASVGKSTLSGPSAQLEEPVVDELTGLLSKTVLYQRKDKQTNAPLAQAYSRPPSRRDPKAGHKYTDFEFPKPTYRFPRQERENFKSCTSEHFRRNKKTFRPNFSYVKSKPGIKCPRQPIRINYEENKVVVDTIIAHLDKASGMSSNIVAIYDKALLYRQIEQSENALNVLEHLMQNENEFSSNVMLANTYEQAAFCINDILSKTDTDDMEKREQMQVDRDFYLKSSIEISCNLVDKIPFLHNCWKSAATLRNILFDNLNIKRTKKTLQELWFLYNKLHEHFEAVEILKELQRLAEDEEEKIEIIEDLIKHHLCLHNFEEAVITICMCKQLRDGHTPIENSLFVQVYIEAGLDAFRKKHYDKARMRIREVFKEQKPIPVNKAADLTGNDERFDLFILSNLDDEECGQKLMEFLNNLGLKTTFNTDSPSIIPGTPEIIGMTDIMSKSNSFAILVDFDINDRKMLHITDRIQKMVEDRDERTFVVVITLPETVEIPPASTYSTYKRICMDLNFITNDLHENEENENIFYDSVKSLLTSLASADSDIS